MFTFPLRRVLKGVLLPCGTQLMDLSTAVARRAAVARLGLKRRATFVPTSIHRL